MQYNQHSDVPIPEVKTYTLGGKGEEVYINFNPHAYSTPEAAAKGFYEAMKKVVIDCGQNPESELHLFKPGEGLGNEGVWQVSWEAGPYDWAIGASLSFMMSKSWYTEPYYGFDLCFELA